MSLIRLSYYRLLSYKNPPPIKLLKSSIDSSLLNKGKKGFVIAAATAASTAKKRLAQPTMMSITEQYQNFSTSSSLQTKKLQGKMNDENKGKRKFKIHQITKNLTFCTTEQENIDKDPETLKLKQSIEKPLAIIFSWLMAKQKNLHKYAELYTDQGFDVLTIEITPWQLLWPVKGAQLVAKDVLKFLENNEINSNVVLHGFSVGGYVWGEVMVEMAKDLKRYQPILDKIVAQIWDSAADVTEIPEGVPKSIFPKNLTLQNGLKNYTLYHLKTFHEQATQHYINSSQQYHNTLVKAPSLFFISKNDLVGAERSNKRVHDNYEAAGIKCTWKCWDKSEHVLHYRHHKDEYLDLLFNHLQENFYQKLREKSRAKL